MKKMYLDFLGSKKFPDILEQEISDPMQFNSLMVAHLGAVASQSTGLMEGCVQLRYIVSTQEHFTPDVIGPDVYFAFYTPRYALIEKSLHTTRSASKVTNTNDFSYSDYRNCMTFHSFMEKCSMRLKHLPGHTWESIKGHDLKIEYNNSRAYTLEDTGATRSLQQKRIDYLYEAIIGSHLVVESFLNFYFIDKKLEHKTQHHEHDTRSSVRRKI